MIKLTAEQPQLNCIGDNFSNAELVRMLEHVYKNPPHLLQLAINRLADSKYPVVASQPSTEEHNNFDNVPSETRYVDCPCCGSKLIVTEVLL